MKQPAHPVSSPPLLPDAVGLIAYCDVQIFGALMVHPNAESIHMLAAVGLGTFANITSSRED